MNAELGPWRAWQRDALEFLINERNCRPTPLFNLVGEKGPGKVWIKDESYSPSGSIKHRLARRLFWRAVIDGRIGPTTTLYDASSGSMALSEAWFAKKLGLRLEIVAPATISREKQALLSNAGIRLHFSSDLEGARKEAAERAAIHSGFFLDQFANAADAYGHDLPCGIYSELQEQMGRPPEWIVAGAGTGGTIASLARASVLTGGYSKVCLADPEGSIFHFLAGSNTRAYSPGSWLVDGVGSHEPRPAFLPSFPSFSIAVSDEQAVGASWALSQHLGRPFGSSAGMNLWAAALMSSFPDRPPASDRIVVLNPDDGARYTTTALSEEWCAKQGLGVEAHMNAVSEFLRTGRMPEHYDFGAWKATNADAS